MRAFLLGAVCVTGALAATSTSSIPVLDMTRLVAGEYDAEDIAALRDACCCPGFFHVINHGIPDEVVANFEAATRAFFALPREAKRAVKRTAANSRGYADDEFTKRTRDLKELYDFGHAPRPDLAADAPENVVADGFNQIPACPGFEGAVADYYDRCGAVCGVLARGVAASLGLAPDALDDVFAGGHTSYLRLNYYPPHGARFEDAAENLDAVRGGAADDAAARLADLAGARLGVNRHTDAGVLTLLLQDRTVSSLQVNAGAGGAAPRWVDVDPIPGALTVNVGDMLQVLSNGAYRAPEHRVLASGPGQERISAPFFYNPAYDATVAPRADRPRYRPFSWGHFRRRRFEGDYADEGVEIQIADFLIGDE